MTFPKAMCAKFVVVIAEDHQPWLSWLLPIFPMQRSTFRRVYGRGYMVKTRWMQPKWTRIPIGQAYMIFGEKMKANCGYLGVGTENERCFLNSFGNWSPCLYIQGITLENQFWIEAARKANNKGLVHLKDFWEESRQHQKDYESLQRVHFIE